MATRPELRNHPGRLGAQRGWPTCCPAERSPRSRLGCGGTAESQSSPVTAPAPGFDFAAMRGQIEAWHDGERPRGASTITMQAAKNLLLWPGRDPVRKALEAWLTPQLALLWPKRRILEVYLNIVEFGPGLYGAEAAARAFFGKPASALSARDAARLAAVLPNPLRRSAATPGPHLRQRAAVIERRVEQIRPLLACAR